MSNLTDEAASDFLFLTRLSFEWRLIGRSVYEARLTCLLQMCDPNGPWKAIVGAFCEGLNLDDQWPEEDGAMVLPSDIASDGPVQDRDDPRIMGLVVNLSSSSSWKFHKGDVDNFPSIPHGHDVGSDRIKLDAYQGWTYFRTKQTGRLPRQQIVDLWNNNPFREFARDHIEFYLGFNPGFRWRVHDPRRIPKRR